MPKERGTYNFKCGREVTKYTPVRLPLYILPQIII